MTDASRPTVHASAVLVEGNGVLIRGPSGAGKSSLVLALLLADRARNRLVADDRVILGRVADRVVASAPAAIAGLLEVRGQGILRAPHVEAAPIDLVVDLEPLEAIERFPGPDPAFATIEGVKVRRIVLAVGAPEAWMRVMAALCFAPLPVSEGWNP